MIGTWAKRSLAMQQLSFGGRSAPLTQQGILVRGSDHFERLVRLVIP